MKLNNKGWGLRQLLIMSGILLLILLLVSYYIYVLYNNLDTREGMQYYKLENSLKVAALNYINAEKFSNFNGTITVQELKRKGYLENFSDFNDNECDGYVIVENNDYDTYISCKYYTSKSYNKNIKK